jgi:cytochrome c peroxidase
MSPDARAWILVAGFAAAGAWSPAAVAACPEHLQFLESRCEQWPSHLLPLTLPAARGNAVADSDPAAALGMRVFYDNRFSQSGSGVACANCHDPEHAFSERKATSHTIREVARNASDLLNAAWYTRSHFWDGKVDSLWSAPLFTLEQPDEMGATRLGVVHTISAIYRTRYEALFGPLPDLSDTRRFPQSGKPGDPQFDAMSAQDRDQVNQAYANVGKALEAYMRKLAAGRSSFDDFLMGHTNAISAGARRGMAAFSRHGCDGCHAGPTFTDEEFHDLGFEPAAGRQRDSGREGKGFRTPSLRNVTLTFPYGHDGAFTSLEQIIDAHAAALPGKAAPDAQDRRDIVEFLRTLTGRPPQPPWNYWPGG